VYVPVPLALKSQTKTVYTPVAGALKLSTASMKPLVCTTTLPVGP
jgi:hypothetical protein